MRKSHQGVWNIVRFNWHFYVLAIVMSLGALGLSFLTSALIQYLLLFTAFMIVFTSIVSLLVSYYVYDCSNLYKLKFLDQLIILPEENLVNIHAGFDETSVLLKEKFKTVSLSVLDFYDPHKHTEVSIKRARKAYPPFPNTQKTTTHQLPLKTASVDVITLIFSVHEIRDADEREVFFKELYRVLKPTGKIIIVEHLRDVPNFLAYTIGFLHFYSKNTWLPLFTKTNFTLEKEQKVTPFVSSFTLNKNAITS